MNELHNFNNDAERLAEVNEYVNSGIPAGENYNRFTALAASVCNANAAFLGIIHQDQVDVVSCFGIQDIEPFSKVLSALCFQTIRTNDVLVVEAGFNQDLYKEASSEALAQLQFFAGVPLTTSTGYNIGVCGIMDDTNRRKLSEKEWSDLADIGKLIVIYMELERALVHAQQQSVQTIKRLAHDLKNPLTIVSLQSELLKMEPDITPEMQEMSQQISDAGRKINTVINSYIP